MKKTKIDKSKNKSEKNTKAKKAAKTKPSKKELGKRAALISVAVILSLWTVIAIGLVTLKLMTYEPVWDELYDEDFRGEYDTVSDEDGTYCLVPKRIKAGLIFYTGGLVEHSAYLPLMETLASRGVLCVMPKLTLNLAFLEVDAADGYKEKYAKEVPDNNWYLGGHSLGGVAASKYFSEHLGEYAGLVLLASYTTEDLTLIDVPVISIYGSEDKILNMDNYEENKANLPAALLYEYVIEGANHSGYASYGHQRGDGEASITPSVQREKCADIICGHIIK